jgi:hypothetical protein
MAPKDTCLSKIIKTQQLPLSRSLFNQIMRALEDEDQTMREKEYNQINLIKRHLQGFAIKLRTMLKNKKNN